MNVLVLKTNVDTEHKLKVLSCLLDDSKEVKHWSLDQEDFDNVLRVEASESTTIPTITQLLISKGLICEELD